MLAPIFKRSPPQMPTHGQRGAGGRGPTLPGDRVWLDAGNIVTRCPSRKLDHRRLGLFEVVADARLQTPYAVRLSRSP